MLTLPTLCHQYFIGPTKPSCQQKVCNKGDPLGPLLFCLTIHSMCSQLVSELNLFYLDDGTLGGSVEDLRHDLEVVKQKGAEIGLQLNSQKSEIICINPDIPSCSHSQEPVR